MHLKCHSFIPYPDSDIGYQEKNLTVTEPQDAVFPGPGSPFSSHPVIGGPHGGALDWEVGTDGGWTRCQCDSVTTLLPPSLPPGTEAGPPGPPGLPAAPRAGSASRCASGPAATPRPGTGAGCAWARTERKGTHRPARHRRPHPDCQPGAVGSLWLDFWI